MKSVHLERKCTTNTLTYYNTDYTHKKCFVKAFLLLTNVHMPDKLEKTRGCTREQKRPTTLCRQ